MAITSPVYDPDKTATTLTEKYMKPRIVAIDAKKKAADAAANGLTTLRGALSAFQTALAALTGKKSVIANSAAFSSTVGTATASPTAAAGAYSFYVEQLATASQVAYTGLPTTAQPLEVRLGGAPAFAVDLSTADTDGTAGLSTQEIAAAINKAPGNNSTVSASSLTVNGVPTVVLTSKLTGVANAATLGTPGGAATPGMQTLATAQDAKVWVGPKTTGTLITQASNTYNVIDGVSMTFTKAQGASEDPVTLTVGNDATATAANVQEFVEAYNKLSAALADLTYVGNPQKKLAPGVFANDSGLLSLQSRLLSGMRTASGTQSLTTFGITAQRNGTLALDTGRLTKALAANPTTLDQIFGNASLSSPSGVLGDLNGLTREWTSTTDGAINARQVAVTKQQSQISIKLEELAKQEKSVYDRYKAQFTKLQVLQEKFTNTSDLFDQLFGNKAPS